MCLRAFIAPLVLLLITATASPRTAAQNATSSAYPTRAVRVIIPYAAGGVGDILGRIVSQRMADVLGQPFVVENRGGAAGTIGSDMVAKAVPDGYTLMASTIGAFSIAPHLLKSMPYDPATAFTAIGGVARSTSMLVVGASQPIHSVADLIARAKASPGRVSYGSAGIGSIGHLTGELLAMASGIEMTHIPYKSAVLAFPEVINGSITLAIDTLPSVMQFLRAGSVRPLAMLSLERVATAPAVPSIAEAGFPEAVLEFWSALHAPAHLPAPVTERLAQALARVLAQPEMRVRLEGLGAEPWSISGPALDARARVDRDRIGKVVKAAGIQAE